MKRKISAKEFLADARAGLTDLGLMDKYDLSIPAIQALFRKLVEHGLMSGQELEDRLPLTERSVKLEVFRCPACKMPQFVKFDECPQCGVIVSKLSSAPQSSDAAFEAQEPTRGAIAKPLEPPPQDAVIGYEPFADPLEAVETPSAIDPSFLALDTRLPFDEPARRTGNGIKISILMPPDMLNDLNGLGGDLSEHVAAAVKTYLAERLNPPTEQ